eukprot:3135465-Rhodomonas_salina.2
MPRKKGAAKGGSEIAKALSSSKSLESKIEYVEKLRDMEEEEMKPKLEEDGAAALHALLETVRRAKTARAQFNETSCLVLGCWETLLLLALRCELSV